MLNNVHNAKGIVYGVIISKLPMKDYLNIPSHILLSIANEIVDELVKERIINV